ncbi:MAG: hypothetical protein KME26_24195 [Oscillatoria princeps RMCB-10]|nr:hypothetical protein [Oscillatoria princeps RMCB-10]
MMQNSDPFKPETRSQIAAQIAQTIPNLKLLVLFCSRAKGTAGARE